MMSYFLCPNKKVQFPPSLASVVWNVLLITTRKMISKKGAGVLFLLISIPVSFYENLLNK